MSDDIRGRVFGKLKGSNEGRMEDCEMEAAIYMRVGNKDQLSPETDIEKSGQKSESFCDRKKEQIAGEYVTQKDRKQAICFVTAQPGDTEEIRSQKIQIEAYCEEHGLSLSCVYERNSREL